jgi:hypothetical protein
VSDDTEGQLRPAQPGKRKRWNIPPETILRAIKSTAEILRDRTANRRDRRAAAKVLLEAAGRPACWPIPAPILVEARELLGLPVPERLNDAGTAMEVRELVTLAMLEEVPVEGRERVAGILHRCLFSSNTGPETKESAAEGLLELSEPWGLERGIVADAEIFLSERESAE